MVTAVILIALGVLGPGAAIAATPGPRRRGVTTGYVVTGVLVLAAGVVFALVTDGATLLAADTPVLDWMVAHRSPGATSLAEGLAFFGGTTFTGGAAVVTAAVLAWWGRRVWALCWVVAVAVGATTIRVLKLSVERPRPPELTRLAQETSTSLPSGHSLMAALGLGLTAAAIVLLTRGGGQGRQVLGWLVAVLAVVLAAAIGASRAYLGVHWTTDVAAGWLLGAAIATLAVTVARDREPVGDRAPTHTDRDPGGERAATRPTDRPVDPLHTAGRPVNPSQAPAGRAEADRGDDPH
jgi:undecaprenyl-diphosphatase